MRKNPRSRNPLFIKLSLLILSGTILGRVGAPWWFLGPIGCITCLLSLIVHGNHHRILVSLGFLLCISTWSAIHRQTLESDDLMLFTGYDNDPVLVHLEGRIIDIQGRRIDLDTTFSHQDVRTSTTGRVVILLPYGNKLLGQGDLITVKGWLHGIRRHEAGEPDWRSIAIDGDYRGWMRVKSMDLIRIKLVNEPWVWNALKSHARTRLLSSPIPPVGDQRTLLGGLLLGMRGPSWNEVSRPFRKTGVSHLLAISGLHVSLVLLLIMPLIRIGGGHKRWHSIVAMLVLVIYLSIIETRTPVIRAGIMSAFLYVPFLFNRRIPVKGVLAFTMSMLLIADPRIVSQISFQLSFGVVSALVFLSPHVQQRVFPGRFDTRTTPLSLFTKWVRSALVVSTVAWLISLPATIYSFGQISFLAVPMTLIMTPIVCFILFTASLRLLLGWMEIVDQVTGHLLMAQIDLLQYTTQVMAGIEFLSMEDVHTDPAWALLATIWVSAWCLIERRRILLLPSFTMLFGWILIANQSG